MLVDNFYNLAERKKPPMVKVEAYGGDVELTFTDSVGDELQVRLCVQTCADVVSQILRLGWPDIDRKLRAKLAAQLNA